MTHHDHEVVERGSGAVASVAIVVLVIIAIVAVVAFGGLNWLRNNDGGSGGANEGAGEGNDNPSVLPTVPVETVMPPAPESFNRPGMGARSTG